MLFSLTNYSLLTCLMSFGLLYCTKINVFEWDYFFPEHVLNYVHFYSVGVQIFFVRIISILIYILNSIHISQFREKIYSIKKLELQFSTIIIGEVKRSQIENTADNTLGI